jgi:hypothetical protein
MNEQNNIVKKIIEKAMLSGYSIADRFEGNPEKVDMKVLIEFMSCRDFFSKEFAEAFWGDKPDDDWYYDEYWTDNSCCSGSMAIYRGKRWQYHLQQMVLKEYPIKYLQKFM